MKLKCPHAFPQHLLGLKCPPPPRGTFRLRWETCSLLRNSCEPGDLSFFSGGSPSKESPQFWVGQLWSAVNWCQLSPFSPFLSVCTDLLSPKGFTLPPSFFCYFSGVSIIWNVPSVSCCSLPVCIFPIPKDITKSHLLHNGHAICLLWFGGVVLLDGCIFFSEWKPILSKNCCYPYLPESKQSEKAKSNLIPAAEWQGQCSPSHLWLECLTPIVLCFFFLNSWWIGLTTSAPTHTFFWTVILLWLGGSCVWQPIMYYYFVTSSWMTNLLWYIFSFIPTKLCFTGFSRWAFVWLVIWPDEWCPGARELYSF